MLLNSAAIYKGAELRFISDRGKLPDPEDDATRALIAGDVD